MKPTNKWLGIIAAAGLISTTIWGCQKDAFDISTLVYDRAVAIPLIDTEMDIYDMLDSDTTDLISVVGNELIITYASDLISFTASDMIVIPDQSNSESFTPASALPDGVPFSGTTTVSESTIYNFNVDDGVEVTSIILNGGSMDFTINNTFAHELVFTISIPELTDGGGSPFNETITVAASQTATASFDLTNHTFDLTRGNTTTNELEINFDITINGSGANINASDAVGVDFNMAGLTFSAVYGDFKNKQLTAPSDSIFLSLFKATDDIGNFEFTNPKVNITVENSFGFAAGLSFQQFYSMDESSVKIADITYDFTGATQGNPAPYGFPNINQPAVEGNIETTEINMTTTNSNVSTLFTSTPKYLNYEAAAESNPGSPTGNNNFVLEDSKLKISTKIELPLEGKASDWALTDTVPFNFQLDQLFTEDTKAEDVQLKIETDNGFPLEATLAIILLDDNFSEIQTLASGANAVKSGAVDGSGEVTESVLTLTTIDCDRTCIQNLNVTKHLIIKATTATTDNGNDAVKLTTDYKFALKIGLLMSGILP